MVAPQKIKYNNIFSDVGLGALDIILDVAFDSDNGATSSYLNRSAVASESYDGRYKNTYRYKYDELFSPQFTIVKKDFSDFTQDEARKVLKYLTSTDKPALLEVYYDGASNVVDWACIGGFTNIETYKIANSRIVGIVAQFEAITPYAMSRIHGQDENDSPIVYDSSNKITIEVNTDDNKPIYPRITIKMKVAGDIKIINQHSSFLGEVSNPVSMTIKNNANGEILVVDGTNKIIGSKTNNRRIFGDDFVHWAWLPLYEGYNELTVEGNCEISIEYRTVIKCGEY